MSKAIQIRELSHRVASHPRIEQAVRTAISSELPFVIQDILSELYPGESVQIYAPKKPTHIRQERNAAIRMEFNGQNAKALSVKYRISISQIQRIVAIL